MNAPSHAQVPTLSIRPCRAEDIAEITGIYAHAVIHGTASFELEAPTQNEMQSRFEALVSAGYPYLAATQDAAIVGYAYAGAYRARPAYRGTVENSVYIRPDMQGRGVGRALLQALIEESEGLGFRQMIAVIGDSANHASRRLHESVGFELTGVLKSVGWKHGRWLDTVLMQRALGPGDTMPR